MKKNDPKAMIIVAEGMKVRLLVSPAVKWRRLTKSFQAELTTSDEYIAARNSFEIAYDPLPTMKTADPAEGKGLSGIVFQSIYIPFQFFDSVTFVV